MMSHQYSSLNKVIFNVSSLFIFKEVWLNLIRILKFKLKVNFDQNHLINSQQNFYWDLKRKFDNLDYEEILAYIYNNFLRNFIYNYLNSNNIVQINLFITPSVYLYNPSYNSCFIWLIKSTISLHPKDIYSHFHFNLTCSSSASFWFNFWCNWWKVLQVRAEGFMESSLSP